MTKPTNADLERQLAAMTKRAEDAERERDKFIGIAMALRDGTAVIKSDLAAVLEYIGCGWLGAVQENYKRLKRFVEGAK